MHICMTLSHPVTSSRFLANMYRRTYRERCCMQWIDLEHNLNSRSPYQATAVDRRLPTILHTTQVLSALHGVDLKRMERQRDRPLDILALRPSTIQI